MKSFLGSVRKTFIRLTNIGTWESATDAMVFVGAIVFAVTLIINTVMFLVMSKMSGFDLTLLVWKMERLQSNIFYGFVFHTIFATVVITYVFVRLYDRIINSPVSEMKVILREMAMTNLSEYITTGKISDPFRDSSKTLTWQDQAKFYVDTAAAEKYIDELTGCFNRKYFIQKLSSIMQTQMIASVKETTAKLKTYDMEVYGVFMIDIDHFKKVNDDFGHASGDQVLIKVGKTLRELIKDRGVVIRNGGEEFVVVSSAKYPFDFATIADEINDAFRDNINVRSPLDGTYRRITCSVGFVSMPFFPDMEDKLDLQQHVDLADMAMYLSKTHGRDQWNELKMTKNPPEKIDINVLCSDIEYGLKRGFFKIRNKYGEYNDLDDIRTFA